MPKGWGKSAKGLTPIAKEDPEGFKKKGRFDGHDRDFGDRGKDKDRDKDKGQASKDFDRDGRDGKKDGGPPAPKLPPPVVKGGTGDQSKEKFGATGDRDGRGKDKDKDKDKSKGQASKDFDRDGKQGRKGKDGAPPPPPAPPPIVKGGTGDGDIRTQTEFGTLRQHDNKDKNKNKNKNQNFGNQGGSDQFKQGGGGSQRKQKTFGDQGGRRRWRRPACPRQPRRWRWRRWRRRQEEGQVPEESQSPVLPELDRCPAASPEAAIANEKGGWLKPTAFHFKCRPSDVDKSADLSDVRQEASIVSGFRRAPRARSLESALT